MVHCPQCLTEYRDGFYIWARCREDPSHLPGWWGGAGIGATPLWVEHTRIMVSKEFEDKAREALEPLEHPQPGTEGE